MKQKYDLNYDMNVTTIFPGEIYVTRKAELITTLLGSCIAVVLIDPVNKIGGMNHFMLPGSSSCNSKFSNKEGRYGICAMELLLEKMISLGGEKRYFQSKVFGGGSVLQNYSDYAESVPAGNIRFVIEYLSDESIPVVSSDLGGIAGRRVYFFTGREAVLVKKIETPVIREKRETEDTMYSNETPVRISGQYLELAASI